MGEWHYCWQEALWRRASGKWDAADTAATEAAAATARVRILQRVGVIPCDKLQNTHAALSLSATPVCTRHVTPGQLLCKTPQQD